MEPANETQVHQLCLDLKVSCDYEGEKDHSRHLIVRNKSEWKWGGKASGTWCLLLCLFENLRMCLSLSQGLHRLSHTHAFSAHLCFVPPILCWPSPTSFRLITGCHCCNSKPVTFRVSFLSLFTQSLNFPNSKFQQETRKTMFPPFSTQTLLLGVISKPVDRPCVNQKCIQGCQGYGVTDLVGTIKGRQPSHAESIKMTEQDTCEPLCGQQAPENRHQTLDGTCVSN